MGARAANLTARAAAARQALALAATLGLAAAGAAQAAQAAPAADAANTPAAGAAVFGRTCFACHGAQGQGTVGIAPALAGPLAPVLASAEGRGYVARVLLHGLSGRIVSQGQTFMGAMPAQANALSDAELADVANFLAQGLNAAPAPVFQAEDFAQARAQQPAPSHKALRELRAKVMP